MPARWVIHAATMELGGPTSAEIIEAATRSTLACADELGARSLALVAFGTGVGGFPLEEAARLMVGAAREHERGLARARRVRGPRRRGRARVRRRRGFVTRPVLVAPDSFKGTFSAQEVAAAVARGGALGRAVRRSRCRWRTAARGRRRCWAATSVPATVSGPLGDPVDASFVLRPDGSAVVECAAASGLGLVKEAERDAWAASTYGTGRADRSRRRGGRVLGARGRGRVGHHGRRRGAIEALKEAGRDAADGGAVRRAHAVRGRRARVRPAEGRRRGDGRRGCRSASPRSPPPRPRTRAACR